MLKCLYLYSLKVKISFDYLQNLLYGIFSLQNGQIFRRFFWAKIKLELGDIGVMILFSEVRAADERYAVEVSVDVTDTSAAEAQKRAMNEANRAAVSAVAKRITTSEGVDRFATMTDEQLMNFIKEVSVINEKSSAVRYIANLRVVLNEDILAQYMKEREIPLLNRINEKIMIVPIFREFSSDVPQLWESSNIWKQSWDKISVDSAINLEVIPTSGANYAIMDGRKAAAMDGEALDKILRINSADEIYVLDAVYDGIEGLVVQGRSFNGDSFTTRVDGPRSSGMELFDKAVAEVQKELENRISKINMDKAEVENVAVMLFSYQQLPEWVRAETVIKQINLVNNLEVQAIGNGKVQFKLSYVGELDKLMQQLKARSYNLVEHNGYYSLEQY